MNEDNQWIVEHFEELVDTYGSTISLKALYRR